MSKSLVVSIPGAVALPDNVSHTNRMEIRSESSNRLYVVAQSKNSGEWQCSCPGWIMKRPGKPRGCKHLKTMESALLLAGNSRKAIK